MEGKLTSPKSLKDRDLLGVSDMRSAVSSDGMVGNTYDGHILALPEVTAEKEPTATTAEGHV
jgi:hypothetical protein